MARLIDADEMIKGICFIIEDSKELLTSSVVRKAMLGLVERIKTVDAPTVGGWISVKNRLPEIDKDVLVFAKPKICGENTITITHLTDSFYFGGSPIKMQEPQWNSPWQYFRSNYVITHWQYLPEPPKEEDDAEQ